MDVTGIAAGGRRNGVELREGFLKNFKLNKIIILGQLKDDLPGEKP